MRTELMFQVAICTGALHRASAERGAPAVQAEGRVENRVVAQHVPPARDEHSPLVAVFVEPPEGGAAPAEALLVQEMHGGIDERLPAPRVELEAEMDVGELDGQVLGVEPADRLESFRGPGPGRLR